MDRILVASHFQIFEVESRAHLCPVHEHKYPEIYAAIKSTAWVDEEEWESHGVVPDLVGLPTIECPDSKTEFLDIVEEFLVFAATPGVATIHFRYKLGMRLLLNYHQEWCRKHISRKCNRKLRKC